MTSVKRLTRAESRERNRAALVAAARRSVVAKGYAATSLDGLAAEVGLTKGAVYSSFGSKLDLLVAVVEDDMAGIVDLLPEGAATAEDLLTSLADLALAMARDPEARSRLVLEAELVALALREPRLHDALIALEERRVTQLAERLRSLPRAGAGQQRLTARQAEECARAAVAALQGLAQAAVATPWTPMRSTAVTVATALLP